MNCPNCNTPNEATAKFCRNCGTKLASTQASNKDLVYLLVIIAWQYIKELYWLVLNKAVIPNCCKIDDVTDYDLIRRIYNISNWVTDILTIIILLVFAAMAGNRLVKVMLIIFGVLQIAMLAISHLLS